MSQEVTLAQKLYFSTAKQVLKRQKGEYNKFTEPGVLSMEEKHSVYTDLMLVNLFLWLHKNKIHS